ncbi:hypothetical protein QCA50_002699 [Cerrena zonata]|uniref:Survival protein SurE-like phosphatase/nucleotidase domain-containing protein n=1 Tax=Cerrena zonata TaxID=2478898 RepID=A0AAW0GHL1_9APHY
MSLAKFVALTAALLVTSASALNILLTNDDSWASANIRATYSALKDDGHDVVLVGPAVQQSGKGGTAVLPTVNITAPGGEFGTVPVGAPYFGHELNDTNIYYFNATPSESVLFGLDIVIPQFFDNRTIDLVVSGPNEGNNLGPFTYTLSGTIGAAYTAVERGVPAIAFSAGNGTHRSYTTNTGLPDDPANIAGRLSANLVAALASGFNGTGRLLPLGVGLNVNFPLFTPGGNCTAPPYTFSRLTGSATIDKLFINSTTGFPQFEDFVAPGLNTVNNGVAFLPGETDVVQGCASSISVFSVDYDAPSPVAEPVQVQLSAIIGKAKL